MFLWLLSIYFGILLGIFLATVFLIVFGQNWGRLPRLYLKIVKSIQSHFPDVYPKDVTAWPSIIDKSPQYTLTRHKESSKASFQFLNEAESPFELCQDALVSGIESIIQDGVLQAYDPCPSYSESLLHFTPLNTWNQTQKLVFYATLGFRFLILFPIRLALFMTSLAWVLMAVAVSFVREYSDVERTSIGIIYCRLYNASMGLVAKYHQEENRPQKPGIAISNHMSPNDAQALFAGVEHGATFGYVVTGQRHTGLIGFIQRMAERVSPCMWLERKSGDERKNFQEDAIKIAKQSGPVLLFPEGYCSNNTMIFQFRKALFQDDVNIYPIAFKQDGRYGDGFWIEDEFYIHLVRLMSSWALVYDVTYLPKMSKRVSESAAEFAGRCQSAIGETAGIPVSGFDGGLKYKQEEQQKLRVLQEKICAEKLVELFFDGESSMDGSISEHSSEFASSGYGSFNESGKSFTESLIEPIEDTLSPSIAYLRARKCSQEVESFFDIQQKQEQIVQ
ncbi:unnamed protein product, partial [Mesorhabditis belari]|uniref:Phospholipid/glycerol acyltransferase domain-containing protein n=1 Tax=Mesorhabditis belari TaxID=2138241 RepID=A0AAF3ERC4_9BILA